MGTIAEKIEYLSETKNKIMSAIESKGVTIPSGTTFREAANLISQINSGGGSNLEELVVTPTGSEFTISGSDRDCDGFSEVTVAGDANLIPANIISGVTIYGVEGTGSGGGGSFKQIYSLNFSIAEAMDIDISIDVALTRGGQRIYADYLDSAQVGELHSMKTATDAVGCEHITTTLTNVSAGSHTYSIMFADSTSCVIEMTAATGSLVPIYVDGDNTSYNFKLRSEWANSYTGYMMTGSTTILLKQINFSYYSKTLPGWASGYFFGPGNIVSHITKSMKTIQVTFSNCVADTDPNGGLIHDNVMSVMLFLSIKDVWTMNHSDNGDAIGNPYAVPYMIKDPSREESQDKNNYNRNVYIRGTIENIVSGSDYTLTLDVSDFEGDCYIFAGVGGFSKEQFEEYINVTGTLDTLTGTEGSITGSITDFRIISGDVIATYTAGA